MKRIIFGILWAVVFYFLGCVVVGAIAGGMAGARERDTQRAAAAGKQAGTEAVERFAVFIVLGAVGLAAIGSWKGFLPGTRPSKPTSDESIPRA